MRTGTESRVGLLVFPLILLVSLDAVADEVLRKPQDLRNVEAGRCPTEYVDVRQASLWEAYLTSDRATVFAQVDERRGTLTGQSSCRGKALDHFYVGAQKALGGRWAVKLVKKQKVAGSSSLYFGDSEVCGWAWADDVYFDPTPLRNCKTSLHRKVVSVLDWRLATPGAENRVFERNQLYVAPGSRAKTNTRTDASLNVMHFAYIFKTVSRPSGENGTMEDWYFVSTEALLQKEVVEQSGKSVNFGWIPSSAVVPWDSREVVWPYRTGKDSAAKALLYSSTSSLVKHVVAGSLPTAGDSIEDPIAGFGIRDPLPPYYPYAILNVQKLRGDAEDNQRDCTRRGIECAQVGFVKGSKVAGSDRPADIDLLHQIEQVKTFLKRHSNNLNIVFLMDATGSMDPFIKQTRRVVEELVPFFLPDSPERVFPSNVHVRFGAVAFRDESDRDRLFPKKIRLTERLDEVAAGMRGIDADGGGDAPESVFCAFKQAAEILRFGEAQGQTNIVVVFSDNPPAKNRRCTPNNEADVATSFAGASRHEKIELDAVFVFGLKHENHQGLFDGVNLVNKNISTRGSLGQQNTEYGRDEAGAAEMAQAIVKFVKGPVKNMLTCYGEAVAQVERGNAIVDADGRIVNPECLRTRLEKISPTTQIVDQGDSFYQSLVGVLVSQLVRELGLPEAEARRRVQNALRKHATVHAEMYVPLKYKEGAPPEFHSRSSPQLWRKYVLFDEKELGEYVSRARSVLANSNSLDTFLALWDQACTGFTGEAKELTTSESCEKWKGELAATDAAPLFRMSRMEIERLFSGRMTEGESKAVETLRAYIMKSVANVVRFLQAKVQILNGNDARRKQEAGWFDQENSHFIYISVGEML